QKFFRLSALTAGVGSALLLAGPSVWAASPETNGPVMLQTTIPIPPAATNATGGMYAFDISWVDQATQTYYLGDRSNAAVDVVNAKTGTFVRHITASPAFAGVKLNTMTGAVNNNISGPNGVVTGRVAGQNCLFAGDGPSRVVSFALPSGTQKSDVKTGGMFRADEMAFDPKDRLLAVANNADTPPFVTLWSVSSTCVLTEKSQILLNKANGVDAQNGAEQSVWDPVTQRFYMSIPQVGSDLLSGGIARINPLTSKVETVLFVPFCQPAGLALGPNQTFLAGCSMVFDTVGGVWSGSDTNSALPAQVIIDINGIFAFVNGIGSSDEVWYNSGDNHWYTGSQNTPYSPRPVAGTTGALSATDQGAGLLGVIDGTSQNLDQIVPTFDVPGVKPFLGPPPGHPGGSSHSVAANAANNHVFVPMPANNAILGCLTGCIAVYFRSDADNAGATD
ncbi:MAG TPA: hypothetical protein VGR45_16870, partial [Stellaceae bacterium]|nr:hypothetical protein [Stellaceae bacterium]